MNDNLKTLFKRNVSNGIETWTIFWFDNSYYTKYGLLDGEKITTKPTFCQAKNIGKKNETTIEEQVMKEVNALIKKKLVKENYKESIADIDMLDKKPPMLANVYKNEYDEEIKFIQPKLDGVRCLANSEAFYSRKFSPFNNIEHIKLELASILDKYPSITFDGELYNHDLSDNFNKIVSIVKKLKPTKEDMIESEQMIQYHIYDMFENDGNILTFEERNVMINDILKDLKYIKLVQTERVNNKEDIEYWFDEFTKNGYEGAILRKNKPYEHKRSNNLLKYKKFFDEEYLILDICNGKGNRQDIAGYAVLYDEKTKQQFKASIFGDFEYCDELLKNKEKYINKFGTVKYFCLTPSTVIDGKMKGGLPRFPVLLSVRDYE